MNVIAQILFKILLSLATESVFRALIATGLEQIKNHTETKVDDAILQPVIDALRGDK
jgi:hypothetical protein